MKCVDLFIDTELPPPLNQEELYSYFKKMYLGDLDARTVIINHNIRLVISEVIGVFSNTSYDKEELVSVGLIGLVKSVDTFDITRKSQFATYATRCIANEIRMFMKKEKKHINNDSLDRIIRTDKDGNNIKMEDILYDDNLDFISYCENNELYGIIRQIVEGLQERNKVIIINHFGFINDRRMTQEEIADYFGISQSYVSRLIRETLQIIKIKLEEQKIIEVSKKKDFFIK